RYYRNTALLVTHFSAGEHVFEIWDFMPRYHKTNGKYNSPPEIVRYLKHISGSPRIKTIYDPRLEYALGETVHYIKKDFVVSLTHQEKYDTLFLYTSFEKEMVLGSQEMVLEGDQYFLICYHEKILRPSTEKMALELERTKVYWLDWVDKMPTYRSYNNEIIRSAITLKLLTYDKSGAVLAAATTSLPETIGEVRNWDYRFCWIRDASMVIKVVSELGHFNAAKRFLQFIIDLMPDKDEKLQIM